MPCVRQRRVQAESIFIDPAGMKMKEPPIVNGPENIYGNATSFGADGRQHFAQGVGHRFLHPFARVKPGKDVQFRF
jgi:hypothetical protein